LSQAKPDRFAKPVRFSKKKATRGTDEVFLNLMKVSGNSLLKLLGMAADKAKQYHFQAVVLKDKSLKPDIEGFPTLASEEGRVFIEFSCAEFHFKATLIRSFVTD
jgi:hypothetical protein